MKVHDAKKRMKSFNLNDYDLGGVELTQEDYENIATKATPENLDAVISAYLCGIRKCLDEGLE